MPPSSLYWIQKSASSISRAAGKRSSAASPGERLELTSAARMLLNSPAPTVPAPRAIVLLKKERRLMNRFRGFLFSKLSSRGRFSPLLDPFAVGLIVVFMPVESQRFALRAAREKLRVCYRTRRYRFRVVSNDFAARLCERSQSLWYIRGIFRRNDDAHRGDGKRFVVRADEKPTIRTCTAWPIPRASSGNF